MYTERYSLGFVSGVLVAAAERRRPGLGAWAPAARDALHEVFVSELAQIEKNFLEVFDDRAYFERLRGVLLNDCFVRYCAVAEKQSNLEARDYGLWRGGDLLARGAYAFGGLVVGAVIVAVPEIPINWEYFSLVTMFTAPFIPEAQIALYKKKYARELRQIVDDMRDAEEAHRLYESVSPVVNDAHRATLMDAPEQAEGPTEAQHNGVRER